MMRRHRGAKAKKKMALKETGTKESNISQRTPGADQRAEGTKEKETKSPKASKKEKSIAKPPMPKV